MDQNIRIVSLVPSLTETLCDFGMQNNIKGCTKFCVSPKILRKSALAVGGTKDPDIDKIIFLKPTHIIINQEENTPEVRQMLFERIDKSSTMIIDTFPKNIYDVIPLVQNLGEIFSCQDYVHEWVQKVEYLLKKCKTVESPQILFMYFIWRNPWMIAGDKTYISSMLNLVGFKNTVITGEEMNLRYPVVKEENFSNLKSTDVFMFSSEPFPFKKRHIEEFYQCFNIKNKHFLRVDGQNLSWYGTRSLKCLEYLRELKLEFLKEQNI
ncbi:ABC transporter substrate-binding protein [Fluviispira multicolorata]|uniref:ABC transporter substrate-binding protein n=1 Tax=Fluviispira multicolorata TaxID=2654512 RepID=A0A833JBM0_9BACT|nr:helical backbone metal receptor [Fluviispira multicolorata]KAB8029726.1 ABC transporter substrate-binding protein [Fluviispira multicolorata]